MKLKMESEYSEMVDESALNRVSAWSAESEQAVFWKQAKFEFYTL